MTWFFIVLFPVLLGAPVEVTVKATDKSHCERVYKLLKEQLDDHRSNATMQVCAPEKQPK